MNYFVHTYNCISSIHQLLIDVVLIDSNTLKKSRICKWMLDTWAIGTCISDELAKEMELKSLWTTKNTWATGTKNINYYKMRVDMNCWYIFEPEYVYEFEKWDSVFDVIIWMDILWLWDFSFNKIDWGYKVTIKTPIK